METVKKYFINHPILGRMFIFPFAMLFIIAFFSILIEVILPLFLGLLLSNFLYRIFTDDMNQKVQYHTTG